MRLQQFSKFANSKCTHPPQLFQAHSAFAKDADIRVFENGEPKHNKNINYPTEMFSPTQMLLLEISEIC